MVAFFYLWHYPVLPNIGYCPVFHQPFVFFCIIEQSTPIVKVYSPKLFFRDTLLATVFIYACMGVFAFFAIHLSALDPIHKALADFDYTDLAFKIKNENSSDALLSKEIVVVELGKDRQSIAEQIQIISKHEPKVVALDAWFTNPKDPEVDLTLLSAIKGVKNFVMGAYLQNETAEEHEEHESEAKFHLVKSFGAFGETGTQAFVNFGGEYEKTIRYFLPQKTADGKVVLSFTSAIMKVYDSEKYRLLSERNKEVEYINYTFSNQDFFDKKVNSPELISMGDLYSMTDAELSEKIKNKMVLIGEVNSMSMEDSHFTPYNKRLSGRSKPDMAGVLIHANILKMILQDNYVHKVPTWLIWLISVVTTYLVVLFFSYHFVENHIWYHLYAKIFQLVIAFVVIYIELFLLAKLNLKFDEMAVLAPVFISVDLLYFYDAIAKFFHERTSFNSYFMKHHH